ncbi:4Fe-4S dicluster domain-containing protein, partial [bacterium]|nr:4Fe-4S dicluster domain-containing protein [bacterium]
MNNKDRKIHLKIRRQDTPEKLPYWQGFSVTFCDGMTIADCLLLIEENFQTDDEQIVAPVVWEKCSCTMIINGKVLRACETKVDSLEEPVVLEPLSKFPVIRDLMVDRTKIFEGLREVGAWNLIDYEYFRPVVVYTDNLRQDLSRLGRCNYCGACLEACPQYNNNSKYLGAAVLAQVQFFNSHPVGNGDKDRRIFSVTGEGGISECSFVKNCDIVCPEEIDLVNAIVKLNRGVNRFLINNF